MEMRDRKMLLVFDDCDDLVEQGLEHFQKFLQELLSTTRSVKVLLVLRRSDFHVMGYPNPTVELGPLAFTSAILVLMKLCPSPATHWRETFEALQRNPTLKALQPFLPNEMELIANTLHNRTLCPLGLQGLLGCSAEGDSGTGVSAEATAVFETIRKMRGNNGHINSHTSAVSASPSSSTSSSASSNGGGGPKTPTVFEILQGSSRFPENEAQKSSTGERGGGGGGGAATAVAVDGGGIMGSPALPWETQTDGSSRPGISASSDSMAAYDMSWAMPPDNFLDHGGGDPFATRPTATASVGAPSVGSVLAPATLAGGNTIPDTASVKPANGEDQTAVSTEKPGPHMQQTETQLQGKVSNRNEENAPRQLTKSPLVSPTDGISGAETDAVTEAPLNTWAEVQLQYTPSTKVSAMSKLRRYLASRGVHCVDAPLASADAPTRTGSAPVVVVAALGSDKHDFGLWRTPPTQVNTSSGALKGTIAIQLSGDLSIKRAPEMLVIISAHRRKSASWLNQLMGEITRLVYRESASQTETVSESD